MHYVQTLVKSLLFKQQPLIDEIIRDSNPNSFSGTRDISPTLNYPAHEKQYDLGVAKICKIAFDFLFFQKYRDLIWIRISHTSSIAFRTITIIMISGQLRSFKAIVNRFLRIFIYLFIFVINRLKPGHCLIIFLYQSPKTRGKFNQMTKILNGDKIVMFTENLGS